MRGSITFNVFLYLFILFISSFNGFGEGTKELMPSSTNITQILIANGIVSAQHRDPFALEGGNQDYRLCIHISDSSTEKIYFGLGLTNGGSPVNWRIYAPDNTQAWPTLPAVVKTPVFGQPGYINTYDEAIRGPNILDPLGYDAISLVPTMTGDYYMTFEVPDTTSRNFNYFDITVVSNASGPNTVKPGRIYSKCWQIKNPNYLLPGPPPQTLFYTFSGKMFIYSNDGIVSKLDANNFEGRDFSFSCNESGCFKVDSAHSIQQARRSQTTLQNYPQFKVFLNDPGANDVDHGDYPDGVIGHLVDSSLTKTEDCNGTVTFRFQTAPFNAMGTAEIKLQLSAIVPQPIPPYADVVIQIKLTSGGFHQVVWDGKDANGVQIPSGSTFPITLIYTNGLTHLPLWDVENNINGFKVNLVRPVQTPALPEPVFYWDDQLIPPNAANTINVEPPGCTDGVNGCHGWGTTWPVPYDEVGWGNERTINTWWYLVSSSSIPDTVTYKKAPEALVPVNPPANVCQGGTATFTVVADPASTQYQWVWDGGSQITTQPFIIITFPINATPGTSHVYVNGLYSECPDGPVLDIPFTMHALPVAAINGTDTVCYLSTHLYSVQASMFNYFWIASGGVIISGQGSSQVDIIWNTAGTGNISVIFDDQYGCRSITGIKVVMVKLLPNATISGTTSVCQNSTPPPITFTGSLGTPPYTFTYTINGGPDIIVTTTVGNSVTVAAPTNILGMSTYHLKSVQESSSATCFQLQAGNAFVTVTPLPTATISGNTAVCQNSTNPLITFAGAGTVPPYTFTYNINGGPDTTVTTLIGNSVTVAAPTNIAGIFNYILVSVADVNSPACAQSQTGSAVITIYPLPVTTVVGPVVVCQDFPTDYSYQTSIVQPSPASYSWQITPIGNGAIAPSSNSNPVDIKWSVSGTSTLSIHITDTVGCQNSNSITILVNPKPAVSLIPCFDPVTTRSARRFVLKGGSPPYALTGSPLQGEYLVKPPTPALQLDPGGNYYFNPSVIPGSATLTFNVTYRYTNKYGCPDTTSPVPLIVQDVNPPCSASMTDPRDGNVYSTAMLSGQCWMTENLNYNKDFSVTSEHISQTDNCLVEKYCPPSDPSCTNYGGYYQWDELIQYRNTDAPYQGVCPPAWHIPIESEWQNLIDFIDPAITAPSANGRSGSNLKDPALSFKARLDGIYYLNNGSWSFNTGIITGTMFWTSTQDATGRAIARGLNNPYNPSISKYPSSPANAFPVRCVKD
jgi:uncharacterized protein (TIGR02145 family)